MHLWISEMDYVLLNGFQEHPNAECLPTRFNVNRVERDHILELLLFIRGDAKHLSLQQVSDLLRIS
jgi:hypothetical protein